MAEHAEEKLERPPPSVPAPVEGTRRSVGMLEPPGPPLSGRLRALPSAPTLYVIVLAAVTALGEWWPVLTNPWYVYDDARQHVFWTYRYRDPSLFPGDLYADVFSALAPLGYHACYWLIAQIGDPLTASRWMALGLAAVMLWYAWRLGRAMEPRWGGFLTVVLLLPHLYTLGGGLPRSFALPLLVSHLYFVATARMAKASVLLVLEALVYPQAFLIGFGVQALAVARGALRGPVRRPLALLLVGTAVGGLSLGSRYLVDRPAVLGPMVTWAEAREAPEFQPGGRVQFFDPDPVEFWIKGSRSGLGWKRGLPDAVGLALLVALALGRGIRRTPPIIVDTLLVSAGLFAAAHLLLFRLHLPNRYVRWTLPLAAILFVAAHAHPLAERLRERLPALARAWPHLARGRWVAAAALLVAVAAGSRAAASARPTPPEVVGLHQYLRTLPPAALLAGKSAALASVPLLDRRRILEDREFAQAYFTGYYREVMRRSEARRSAWRAESMEALARFCRDFGLSHLLVDRRAGDSPAALPQLTAGATFDNGRFLVWPCPR
jgi:hypothetical protein